MTTVCYVQCSPWQKKKKNRTDKEGSCLRGAHIPAGKTDTEQTKTIN